jgi:curved DNA-binding protein CbpA
MTLQEAYSLLEVHEGADEATVKTAFKRMALKTHPDKNPHDPEARHKFQRVSEAYKRITDPGSFKDEDEGGDFDGEGFDMDMDEMNEMLFSLFEDFMTMGGGGGGRGKKGRGKGGRSNMHAASMMDALFTMMAEEIGDSDEDSYDEEDEEAMQYFFGGGGDDDDAMEAMLHSAMMSMFCGGGGGMAFPGGSSAHVRIGHSNAAKKKDKSKAGGKKKPSTISKLRASYASNAADPVGEIDSAGHAASAPIAVAVEEGDVDWETDDDTGGSEDEAVRAHSGKARSSPPRRGSSRSGGKKVRGRGASLEDEMAAFEAMFGGGRSAGGGRGKTVGGAVDMEAMLMAMMMGDGGSGFTMDDDNYPGSMGARGAKEKKKSKKGKVPPSKPSPPASASKPPASKTPPETTPRSDKVKPSANAVGDQASDAHALRRGGVDFKVGDTVRVQSK